MGLAPGAICRQVLGWLLALSGERVDRLENFPFVSTVVSVRHDLAMILNPLFEVI